MKRVLAMGWGLAEWCLAPFLLEFLNRSLLGQNWVVLFPNNVAPRCLTILPHREHRQESTNRD